MNILTVDNITKSYGVRKIFDGASFFLQEGEKAGIIGINGTGKSTLLKMIAELEEADDGTVIKANHCLVRYLPQNPEFAPEETVLEAVLRGNRMEENAGTIKVGKINVDEQMELAMRFQVSSIPMLVVFKDGKAVAKSVGYRPKAEITAMVESAK